MPLTQHMDGAGKWCCFFYSMHLWFVCCAGFAGFVRRVMLQVHVLNGERYKEVCPENTLLNSVQLRSCIILPHQKKPLLKRGDALGVTDDTRIFLPVEVRLQTGGGRLGCWYRPCYGIVFKDVIV